MTPNGTEQERTPIELAEIVGLLLVAAAWLIVAAEVVAAVIATLSSPGVASGVFVGVPSVPGPSIADTLARATEWATPLFPLLLLGALAAVWWQVQGWTDVIDDSDETDEGTLKTAFAHLLRAKALSNASLVVLGILIAAVVGGVVATFMDNIPQQSSTVVWAGYLEVIGIGVATILVACAGIWAGLRFRYSINEAFAEVEDDASDYGLQDDTEPDR
ncbi:MAG: hypothetical protein ACLP6E_17105 [Acidimicrobiales bacterium]